jgi:PAS domain S-box-containing protein
MDRPYVRRLAWLPIPVLLAAMGIFRGAGWQGSHESIYVLLTLNLVFSLLVCLVVAYLIARSFLVRSTPGLLLLGCGVAIWGPAGMVATAAAHGDANISITIYNSCVWLSALCHLAGVSLSLRPRRPLSGPALWLLAGGACTAGAVTLATLAALAGWIPAFYVEEQGGTPVRQLVLISAIAMFTLTAALLGVTRQKRLSAFAYWYALALLLIAAGLLGVALQSYHASILGWTGRATQALGGLYMLIAAIVSVRESRVWGISLEGALKEERDFSAAVLDTAGALVVVLDAQGRITRFNRAGVRLTGYSAADVLGRTFSELLIPSDEMASVRETWNALTAGNTLIRHEYHWLTSDGTRRLIDWSSTALRGEAGEVRHIIAIGIDVTDSKQVQEALRDANENLRVQAEQLQTLNDMLEVHQRELETANKDLRVQEQELRSQAAALRESEERYRTLFDAAPDAIVVHREGRFLAANDALLRLAGAGSFQELASRSVLDFFRPEEREQAAERVRQALAGRRQPIRESTLVRLDGREVVVELHTGPIDFQGGPAVQTIIRDVTDRKRTEETLRQTLADTQRRCAEISALMTCTRAVLECRDLVSATHAVFNACRELLGAPAGYVALLTPDGRSNDVLLLEAGGLCCTVDPALPMPIRGLRAEAYRRRQVVYENDFARSRWVELLPPGHVRLESVLFAPLMIDGDAVGLLGLGNKPGGFTDHDAALAVTFSELVAIALRNNRTLESLRELNATLERKVAERTTELEHRARQLQKLTLQLSQAQERESKRVAEILHEDLQQRIAGAKFQVGLLSRRSQDDPSRELAAAHINRILKDAIGMSRSLSHELSPAVFYNNDLGEALGWLAEHMEAKHGVAVHVEVSGEGTLQSEVLTVFLFRAARELLSNAVRHANVRGAVLRLRRRGRYVALRVSDQGRGFDPRKLKETSGFGLLSIRERVELLGGRVKIASVRGRGTRVRIVVPDGSEDEGWRTRTFSE